MQNFEIANTKNTNKIIGTSTGKSSGGYTINENGQIRLKFGIDYQISPKKTYFATYDIDGYPILKENEIDWHLTPEKIEEYKEWSHCITLFLKSIKYELADESPRVLGFILHGGQGAYKTSATQYVMTIAKVPIIIVDHRMQWDHLDRLIAGYDGHKIGIILDECDNHRMNASNLKDFMDSSKAGKFKIVGATTNHYNKLDLEQQHENRPSRWLYNIAVPDAKVEDSVARHIRSLCPEYKAITELALFITNVLNDPNEDAIKHIVKESMKWGFHKQPTLNIDKLKESLSILNINLNFDKSKFGSSREITSQRIMEISPIELVTRMVKANKNLKKDKVENEFKQTIEGFIAKKRPTTNWLN